MQAALFVVVVILAASCLVFTGVFLALLFRFSDDRKRFADHISALTRDLEAHTLKCCEAEEKFEKTARAASEANKSQMEYIKDIEKKHQQLAAKINLQSSFGA